MLVVVGVRIDPRVVIVDVQMDPRQRRHQPAEPRVGHLRAVQVQRFEAGQRVQVVAQKFLTLTYHIYAAR